MYNNVCIPANLRHTLRWLFSSLAPLALLRTYIVLIYFKRASTTYWINASIFGNQLLCTHRENESVKGFTLFQKAFILYNCL